ncbi:hypothetical protein [Herbiconiux daphne]|uniref:Uncharacterized protein n=1 Tax=Herbiconiux daphne TaxID=2970914 RepID=A0ABT2H1S2_9MICO|nr:hypothetical protein [Herbiconiux daphne]MCS5733857.1 hypothetical protein [Herbiconiux daphne]
MTMSTDPDDDDIEIAGFADEPDPAEAIELEGLTPGRDAETAEPDEPKLD